MALHRWERKDKIAIGVVVLLVVAVGTVMNLQGNGRDLVDWIASAIFVILWMGWLFFEARHP